MNKDPIHLICASNAEYNMPLCVMLTSVVDNFDPERELIIHSISNNSGPEQHENVRRSIEAVRPGLRHITIHWHTVDSPLMEKLSVPANSIYSRDTYARLFAPALLPETCHKAIYLDCDLVVLADIGRLYDEATSETHVLHAIHDMGNRFIGAPGGVFDYAKRGIPPEASYFNAGVLVINLKLWRERNLTPPILEYLVQNADKIHFVDQGALNAFLSNDWVPLDPRWNQCPYILSQDEWVDADHPVEEWLRTKNDPYIVHYSGQLKPWLRVRRFLPRRAFFYRYLQKTVHKNTVPHYPYLEMLLGFRLYAYLFQILDKVVLKGLLGRGRAPELPEPAGRTLDLTFKNPNPTKTQP